MRGPYGAKTAAWALVVWTMAGCWELPSKALAFCRMTTEDADPTGTTCVTDGLPLAWDEPCIQYSIDMRGSSDLSLSEVQEVAAQSFDTWETVECDGSPIGFTFRESEELGLCREAAYNSSGGNANVVAFVPSLEVNEDQILALTSVWFRRSTGEILDVDMLINEAEGPFNVCPDANLGCMLTPGRPHDLPNVMTHEVGHFLGLAHSSDSTATMYWMAPAGEVSKRTLAADDIEGICTSYPEGALDGSCDFSPRGGLDVDCETPSSGGCASSPRRGGGRSAAAFGLVLLATWTARMTRRRPSTGARQKIG